ncbi:hypothetical protein ACPPVV_18750 [Rhodanobacter sp. Col0626]|uniref:hypothetical protein n=1 Tax=Rhodanobacter sp. Col0626 TaxID=3415679 RepID=UPI003CE7CED1
MKKLVANLVIALGAAVALTGVLGTPLLQDYLPISFVLSSHSQAMQHYQVALGQPHSQALLSYIAMLAGAAISATGVLLRRRFRGNAA